MLKEGESELSVQRDGCISRLMAGRNNSKIFKRHRGRSCPAGIRFRVNDVRAGNEIAAQERSSLEGSPSAGLTKEENTSQARRLSLPVENHNGAAKGVRNVRPDLANYSHLTGGSHRGLSGKSDGRSVSNHSSTDTSHKHIINESERCLIENASEGVESNLVEGKHSKLNTREEGFSELLGSSSKGIRIPSVRDWTSFYCVDNPRSIKNISERVSSPLDAAIGKAISGGRLELGYQVEEEELAFDFDLELESFVRELQDRKALVLEDNGSLNVLGGFADRSIFSQDLDLGSLETRVSDTELFVENLAGQVEETKQEYELSKEKYKMEFSDLVSLKDEMQSIWSDKENEVREVLERFSAYRNAVEVDSKEKEEIYNEELTKREILIEQLEGRLREKEGDVEELVEVFRQFQSNGLRELSEIERSVNELVGQRAGEESEDVKMWRTIHGRLRSAIAEFDNNGFKKCTNDFVDFDSENSSRCDIEFDGKTPNLLSKMQTPTAKGDKLDIWLAKENEKVENKSEDFVDVKQDVSVVEQQLQPPAEDVFKGLKVLDDNLKGHEMMDYAFEENGRKIVGVNSCDFLQEGIIDEVSVTDTIEDDIMRLLQCVKGDWLGCEGSGRTGDGREDIVEGRRRLFKLLEERWENYQLMCKEKDDELRHWKRRHKDDTKAFQDILEEQELVEAKNRETLKDLQVEIENLRQRNKSLEVEVEMAKEQGEDEVSTLQENFEKDLSLQLRRQSKSFLSFEETSKCQVMELECKNAELNRVNGDLRRQIDDHCAEIKSWVTGILLLNEEEYNEEFRTVSDVLAKLQKFIIENERTIAQLQNQLNEHQVARQEKNSSSDGLLGYSWGGHTGNSDGAQGELCRNCKQAKWKETLMGSFDLVEAGYAIKQDEIEQYVAKIDNHSGNRKRTSLKDSLELADAQASLLRRLGEQTWSSLDTVDEDSLEGRNNSPGCLVKDSEKLLSEVSEKVANKVSLQSFDSGRCSSIHLECEAVRNNAEVASSSVDEENEFENDVPEFGVLLEKTSASRNPRNREEDGGRTDSTEHDEVGGQNRNEESGRERYVDEDKDEMIEGDAGGMGEEENDLVRVVNLYRSLVVDDLNPARTDNQVSFGNKSWNNERNFVDLNKSAARIGTLPQVIIEDVSGKQDHGDEEEAGELSKDHAYLGRRREVQNDVSNENDPGRSDWVTSMGNIDLETKAGSTEVQIPETKVSVSMMLAVPSGDMYLDHETQNSTSLQSNECSEKSATEFPKIVNDNDIEGYEKLCPSCSGIFPETSMNYAAEFSELKSQAAKECESRIARELEETKAEVGRYQEQYEDLVELCEDYQKRISEYSENFTKKNEEMRKLKLNGSVMRTEITWLRQALGITREYCGTA